MTKQLVREYQSKYNGTIQVAKTDGQYAVEVDSFIESGQELEIVWDEVFSAFFLPKEKDIRNILILGFGAGSVMHSIRKSWPNALVTGVEIDPVMITIAKKYFPENLHTVNIIVQDAVKFVRKLPDVLSFDVVIVDCYIGGQESSTIKKIAFLKKLKRIARRVLFNQLFLSQSKTEIAKLAFLRELDTLYTVRTLKLPYNIIIEY